MEEEETLIDDEGLAQAAVEGEKVPDDTDNPDSDSDSLIASDIPEDPPPSSRRSDRV